MLYKIPDFNLEKLEKKVNRIKNKGVDVVFKVGKEIKIPFINFPSLKVKGHEVEVDGFYIINGWQFVATLEHTKNGNIIRCVNADLEKQIPSKYKTVPAQCEHCHKRINRKDTYLVYNLEKDEWKQVGRTCLMSYTSGLDANLCAELASVVEMAFNDQNPEWDPEFEEVYKQFANSPFYVPSESFKKYAYSYIKDYGYEKGKTPYMICNILNSDYRKENNITIAPATDSEIKAIDEYAKDIDTEVGYSYNAKLAWMKDEIEYRDLALVSSFIYYYLKNEQEIKNRKLVNSTKNYVGKVGDKVIIEVDSIRVLYTKDNSIYYYHADPTFVYEIVGKDGNTYICSTGKKLSNALKLEGTLKAHSEYRGAKQNIISRPKILEEKSKEEDLDE